MTKVLDRYIFRELWPPFGLSLVFFAFVFLMAKLIEITKIIVRYNVDVKTILLLLGCSMPSFMQFVIPLSVMISIVLIFLRMSGDHEITAIKAGGISIYRLLPPVLFFALIGFGLTAGMTLFAGPEGRVLSKMLVHDMAAKHLNIAVKPRQFINEFKDVVLYVHEIAADAGSLKDVFIEDQRNPKMNITVVAPRGKLLLNPSQLGASLRLFDGTVHQLDVAEKTVYTVEFETYDVRLDLQRSAAASDPGVRGEKEMRLRELGQFIKTVAREDKHYYIALMEWYKKFSLPVACIALVLPAVPLGIRSRSSKRSYGIGLGLLLFFIYYVMLSIGLVFGETGLYPPLIGMWLPNVVMVITGFVLLDRVVKEAPPPWPKIRQRVRLLRRKARRAA